MQASGSAGGRAADRTSGASSSSSATVSARHSTTSSLPTACVAFAAPDRPGQHADVEQQAAVAVFRQRGQRVAAVTSHARPFERLEQRIREPLRELVEGHAAARWVRCRRRGGCAPDVAERQRRRASWPVSQIGVEARRAASRSSRAARDRRVAVADQRIEHAPKVGRRARAPRPAAAAAPRGPRAPTSGFASPTWNSAAERRPRRCVASAGGVDAQRIAGIAENAPAMNARKLATPRPSERAIALARFALDVAPRGTGAGVEQHADDGEVDLRARAIGRRCAPPARASSSARRSTPPASKCRQRL